MKVVERFVSINGEGTRAGELAVFIRFQGCNLRCSYCDSMYANEPEAPCKELTPEEVYTYIRSTGVRNITLTGGEPLLEPELPLLLNLLLEDKSLSVEIETNGAVDLSPFCTSLRPLFTMDYKLPSSGFEASMKIGNFSLLQAQDTVKFVSGSRADLDRALEIITQYDLLRRCHVYFSPVFGSIEPEEIVNFLMEHRLNGARLQLQMHKFIWDPMKRGV